MRFWARASSGLAALFLASATLAQSYGRLAFAPQPETPGFDLTQEGFRASHAGASLFAFNEKLKGWSLQEANDRASVWSVQGGKYDPLAFRYNVRAPGFEIKVNQSFRLKLSTFGQPLLTVADATYEGVSSSQSRWVLLSFREEQPSILFGFLDGTCSLKVVGKPGAWEVRFSPGYSGWVRVALPFGNKAAPGEGNLVSRLGGAARTCSDHQLAWSRLAPKTVGFSAARKDGCLFINWKFDRPGAVIPPSLVLASSVSGLTIESPHAILTDKQLEGPLALTTVPELMVKFPVRPFVQGRYLTTAMPPSGDPLGGRLFSSAIGDDEREALVKAVEVGVTALPKVKVPGTQLEASRPSTDQEWQTLSHSTLLAALALNSLAKSSSLNKGLPALLWARDPYRLDIPGGPDTWNRAAVACLLSPEPARQAEGALLAAGLVSRARLRELQTANGFPPSAEALPSPDLSYLACLKPEVPSWLAASASPVAIKAGPVCWARKGSEGWILSWMSKAGESTRITLASGIPMRAIASSNLPKFQATSLGTETTIEATAEKLGLCEALLRFDPPEAALFPDLNPSPR